MKGRTVSVQLQSILRSCVRFSEENDNKVLPKRLYY